MGIRREDRVEDVLDPAVAHDEGQALDERVTGDDMSRKSESERQLEIAITQKREGQPQPLDYFKLVVRRLRRDAGHRRARIPQLRCMIAEAAGLRRTAAGATPGMRSQSGVRGGSPGRPVRG